MKDRVGKKIIQKLFIFNKINTSCPVISYQENYAKIFYKKKNLTKIKTIKLIARILSHTATVPHQYMKSSYEIH